MAWGLIVPLLTYDAPGDGTAVHFFGAHTAVVKVARDWDSLPAEHRFALRDLLLALTADAVRRARPMLVLRKLFVCVRVTSSRLESASPFAQLTSLAIRLAPRDSSGECWTEWILVCFTTISGAASSAYAGPTDRIPLIVPARRPHARQAPRARIPHHRCGRDTHCRHRRP